MKDYFEFLETKKHKGSKVDSLLMTQTLTQCSSTSKSIA